MTRTIKLSRYTKNLTQTGDIIQGRFLIEDLIGEGSFGQVYKVIDQKQNDQILAMKMEEYSQNTSMLEREIKVLIQMRCEKLFS